MSNLKKTNMIFAPKPKHQIPVLIIGGIVTTAIAIVSKIKDKKAQNNDKETFFGQPYNS